ncbi:hypothetical protein C176_11214 [Viridibacillus arenosi FSL R5-213]|uniref:Uncharacterized protein n=1 Tax=Viridibacillus arenosi FSL R5-213 TaxID=1227360 RepID=W4EYW6_9BACL|nr:hypothetical protein [Viridibacillus arenosi]ETT85262.1 hypothetical protein C176_11214 [Viridibacillus arenosi FSL R5-213]
MNRELTVDEREGILNTLEVFGEYPGGVYKSSYIETKQAKEQERITVFFDSFSWSMLQLHLNCRQHLHSFVSSLFIFSCSSHLICLPVTNPYNFRSPPKSHPSFPLVKMGNERGGYSESITHR